MKTHKLIRGQSLIEFALIFPFLIFVIIALFDLGRGVFYFSTLNTAVREATRKAIVLKYSPFAEEALKTTIKQYVLDSLFDVGELTENCTLDGTVICSITVTYLDIIPPTEPDVVYDPKVQVSVQYGFKTITPLVSLVIGNDGKIPLEAESSMLLTPAARP